jgi:6-phosphogluconate dehydrogenase (decarboxylating)
MYKSIGHMTILGGPDKNRVYYKDLILEGQTDSRCKDNMITHMKKVFHDTISYGFHRAKGAQAEVLNVMEKDKYNWLNMAALAHTHKTNTQEANDMGGLA